MLSSTPSISRTGIAEQNSVDLCWKLLMSPQYKDLRKAIYSNTDELKRFRQLVVNVVMGKSRNEETNVGLWITTIIIHVS